MRESIKANDIVQLLADEIARPRLVERIRGRWDKTLTVLEAPGGYGKTRVLAQALRSNEGAPIGIDAYVRCRSSHVDVARFGAAILKALGADAERDLDVDLMIERIIDELAIESPTKVGLIIDDAHFLGTNSAAVDMLISILRGLPTNSHLVLVGRTIPELPLARLRADDALIEIGESDLVFDSDEITELANQYDVDASMVSDLAGWPALVRLAVVAGKTGPENFLMQEIVDDLPKPVVHGLAVAVMAGGADDALLQRCGVDLSVSDLTDHVPMVDALPGGNLRPHELWSEVLDKLIAPDDLAEIVEAAATWHSEALRYDEAIMVATDHQAHGVARSVLMDALGSSDQSLTASLTGRWLELFGGSESITDADADLLLLRGWHERLAHGPGHGDEDVDAALRLFHDRGDARGEAFASVESAFRGYLAGDVAKIAESVARGPRLVEAGMTFLRSLGAMTNAVVADINGDLDKAIEHSLRAVTSDTRADFAELGLRHRSTLYFLAGDIDALVRTSTELVNFARNTTNHRIHLGARFLAGDPEQLVAEWDDLRYPATDNKREDFVAAVESVFLDACLGYTPELSTIRDVEWKRPREQFQKALCEWCAKVIAGEEYQANADLKAEITALGIDDPMVQGELRRYLISGYVAVPQVRDLIESEAANDLLGDYQQRLLALARLLVGLRAGDEVDWSAHQSPTLTMSAMSLPWAVEIASGLVLHDQARGLELVDTLFRFTGSRAQPWLRALADSDAAVAAGAGRLLTLLPAPPSEVTIVRTQGDVSVVRDGDEQLIGRTRVRQLLVLLALRGSVSRDVAMTLLWPDKDIDKARNNLRITLTHLRNDLEPNRRSGEPSYHVRQRGDEIVLHRSDDLQIDLWNIIDGLAIAAAAKREGNRGEALQALRDIVGTWQSPFLPDLADLELGGDVDELQARLVDATIEVAEAFVSSGEWERAEELAATLLAHNPYDERAHGARIASHLGAGSETQAHHALDQCVFALGELGVSPSPTTRMLMRRAHYDEQGTRRTA